MLSQVRGRESGLSQNTLFESNFPERSESKLKGTQAELDCGKGTVLAMKDTCQGLKPEETGFFLANDGDGLFSHHVTYSSSV